jgi:parallel beta-helix repeat protein
MSGGLVVANVVSGFGGPSSAQTGLQISGDPSWDCGGNLLRDNTVIAGNNLDYGIGVTPYSSHNVLLNNVIRDMPESGVQVESTGNRLAGNTVSGNGSNGIVVGGWRNLIEQNQVEGNTGCGISFFSAGNHAYRDNMLRGNSGGAVCGSPNTDAGGNIT